MEQEKSTSSTPEAESFKDAALKKADELKEKAGEISGEVADKAEKIWNEVTDKAKGAWEDAKEEAKEWSDHPDAKIDELKGKAKDMWTKVKDAFDGDEKPDDKNTA